MLKEFIFVAAASTLLAKVAQRLHSHQQSRRAHVDRSQQRDDVNRWEAEGGNLPVTPKTR
jgi:hypothetical protein